MKPTSASPHHHSPEEMHNDDVAHEHSDINIKALVWSMVVMFGVVIGTAVLMYLLFFLVLEPQAAARDPKLSPLAMPATTMPTSTNTSPFFGSAPEPKLMTNEAANLKDAQALEQKRLHEYGWVDERAGVARIPIDEAKKLMIERGLPVRGDPLTDEHLGTRTPASGESSSGRNITKPLTPASAAAPAPAATEHKPAAEHK